MVWNSDANSDDLVSDITFWTGADTTAYPLADRSRNANRAQDRVIALILKVDGYTFDDTSNTSTETLDTTTNLVSGTGKYAISLTWLKIGRVRIKDSAGNWITLSPEKRRDASDTQLVASGVPNSYFILGNWIYPRPIPNYASSGGMEVQYQRGATSFVPGDTTKTPGWASPFHRLVSLHASYDYCAVNDMEKRCAKITAAIEKMEADLVDHYSSKHTDMKLSLSPQGEDYGQMGMADGVASPNGFFV